jgi:hypothetical protein
VGVKLLTLAGRFFERMESRLSQKQSEGWRGWGQISEKRLIERLLDNAHRQQWVDVANLALILWAQTERAEYERVQAVQKKRIV